MSEGRRCLWIYVFSAAIPASNGFTSTDLLATARKPSYDVTGLLFLRDPWRPPRGQLVLPKTNLGSLPLIFAQNLRTKYMFHLWCLMSLANLAAQKKVPGVSEGAKQEWTEVFENHPMIHYSFGLNALCSKVEVHPRCRSIKGLWANPNFHHQVWTIFRHFFQDTFCWLFLFSASISKSSFGKKIAQLLPFDTEKANQNQPIWTPTVLIVQLLRSLFFGSSCVVASWSHDLAFLCAIWDFCSNSIFQGVTPWFSSFWSMNFLHSKKHHPPAFSALRFHFIFRVDKVKHFPAGGGRGFSAVSLGTFSFWFFFFGCWSKAITNTPTKAFLCKKWPFKAAIFKRKIFTRDVALEFLHCLKVMALFSELPVLDLLNKKLSRFAGSSSL